MATFRSRPPIDTDWTPINQCLIGVNRWPRVVVLALMCLSCTPRQGSDAVSPEVATIAKQQIDHVTPRRDFVGPAPTRLAWTAVEGVDSYNITVMTEIDTLVFQQVDARGTSVDWPKDLKLGAGTYFWRIVGRKGARSVADSGRSAFVVTTP